MSSPPPIWAGKNKLWASSAAHSHQGGRREAWVRAVVHSRADGRRVQPQRLTRAGRAAVFDGGDNGQREQCGLPNIAGFVTSPKARKATLLAQPVPNPVDKLPVGHYKAVQQIVPDGLQHYGVLTGNVTTTQQQAKQYVE